MSVLATHGPAGDVHVHRRPKAVVLCIGGNCYRLTPEQAGALAAELIGASWDVSRNAPPAVGRRLSHDGPAAWTVAPPPPSD